MKKNVDAAINVYGKPFQTFAALKTLMLNSGRHIDKIYLIFEKKQPFRHTISDFDFVFNKFDNLICFVPELYLFIDTTDRSRYGDKDYRYSLRYQYAWEMTDKKYLYVTHNDVLYKDDIVGAMLEGMNASDNDFAGIGQVGACWMCPAFYGDKCNGDKYLEYKPSFEEVEDLIEKYPPRRNQKENSFSGNVDRVEPMPLPECRLNEWACLINLDKIRHEVVPCGTTDPLGTYIGLDLGTAWFRDLTLKGYKFKNIDIYRYCCHGWGTLPGHNTLLSPYHYCLAEKEAEDYLAVNFRYYE